MDTFSKIDGHALREAVESLECFAVSKTDICKKHEDGFFYDILWAFYCLHADHLPTAQRNGWKWDGGDFGTVKREKFVIGEGKNTFESYNDVYVPNVTKDELIELVKKIEAGKAEYFNRVSDFFYWPTHEGYDPWAKVFS